jgi:nitric oxide synthase oxygenase domain/subunit
MGLTDRLEEDEQRLSSKIREWWSWLVPRSGALGYLSAPVSYKISCTYMYGLRITDTNS